ncbi:tumor necrosis factor receptor superfamily member 1A-like [Diadema antillarum]|uniref:tumor necrosis factor receptor superfamily member 1A-like n=1 Tax=Diadema antillarum TaxID=105358 RepID=UPI003A851BA1
MLVTVFIMVLWAIICFQPGETELCDEGFYQHTPNNDTSRCVPCSLCPPGSRVLTRCSNTTDTVCGPCQKGSFSLAYRGEYCVPCTRCSSHQRRKACSPISDTLCKPSCTRGYYWDQSALDCLRCSYCPPDAPQERVYECEQNGASKDNLCAQGATLRVRMAEYRPRPKSYRQLDRLAEEYPTDNDVTVTSQGSI